MFSLSHTIQRSPEPWPEMGGGGADRKEERYSLMQRLVNQFLTPSADAEARKCLRPQILECLQDPIVVQALIDDVCGLNRLEKCGVKLGDSSLLAPIPEPQVSVHSVRLERIDDLREAELDELADFPGNPERILSQRPKTIPASADPELYSGQKILEFKQRVEACLGDINFRVCIVRASIRVDGREWHDQPIHTVTTFEHEGKTNVGPFFGSTAGLVLRFCPEFSNFFKQRLVANLLLPLIEDPQFASTTIAFPPPHKYNPSSGKFERISEVGRQSAVDQILTSDLLNFSSFGILKNIEGPWGRQDLNHVYYFRGPESTLESPSFIEKISAIRGERRIMRLECHCDPHFEAIEARREAIRRRWIEDLLGVKRCLVKAT